MKSFVTKVLSVALLISAVPGFAMQLPAPTAAKKTVKEQFKAGVDKVKGGLKTAKDKAVDMLKPIEKLADDAAKAIRLAKLDLDRGNLEKAATKADAKFADKVAYWKNTPVYWYETLKAKDARKANAVKYSTIAAGTAAAAGLVALMVYGIKKAYDAYVAKSAESKDSKTDEKKTETPAVKNSFDSIAAKAQELMKNQNPNEIIRSERLWHTAIKQDLKQLTEANANALLNAVIDFDNAFRAETAKRAQEIKQAYAKLVEIVNVCNKHGNEKENALDSAKAKVQSFFKKTKAA